MRGSPLLWCPVKKQKRDNSSAQCPAMNDPPALRWVQLEVVGDLIWKGWVSHQGSQYHTAFLLTSLVEGMTNTSSLGHGHLYARCWLDLQSHNDHWITVITCLEYRWWDTSAVTTYWQPPESLSKCALIAPIRMCIRGKKTSWNKLRYPFFRKMQPSCKTEKNKVSF